MRYAALALITCLTAGCGGNDASSSQPTPTEPDAAPVATGPVPTHPTCPDPAPEGTTGRAEDFDALVASCLADRADIWERPTVKNIAAAALADGHLSSSEVAAVQTALDGARGRARCEDETLPDPASPADPASTFAVTLDKAQAGYARIRIIAQVADPRGDGVVITVDGNEFGTWCPATGESTTHDFTIPVKPGEDELAVQLTQGETVHEYKMKRPPPPYPEFLNTNEAQVVELQMQTLRRRPPPVQYSFRVDGKDVGIPETTAFDPGSGVKVRLPESVSTGAVDITVTDISTGVEVDTVQVQLP